MFAQCQLWICENGDSLYQQTHLYNVFTSFFKLTTTGSDNSLFLVSQMGAYFKSKEWSTVDLFKTLAPANCQNL